MLTHHACFGGANGLEARSTTARPPLDHRTKEL